MLEQFTCETASARQLLTQDEYVLKLGNDVVVREPVALPPAENTVVTVVVNVLLPLAPMLVVSTVTILVITEDMSDDEPVDEAEEMVVEEGIGRVNDAERLRFRAGTGFADALANRP